MDLVEWEGKYLNLLASCKPDEGSRADELYLQFLMRDAVDWYWDERGGAFSNAVRGIKFDGVCQEFDWRVVFLQTGDTEDQRIVVKLSDKERGRFPLVFYG